MATDSAKPLTDEQSCRRLQELGWIEPGPIPPMPAKRPLPDDQTPGVSFFRTHVQDVNMSGLTLPRSFFARSEVRDCLMRSCNLAESTLCWNNFTDVDFSNSDLSRSDLRSSLFERVMFAGANLSGADLRRASFTDCRFDGAVLTGAIVGRWARWTRGLTDSQRAALQRTWREGPEPPGG